MDMGGVREDVTDPKADRVQGVPETVRTSKFSSRTTIDRGEQSKLSGGMKRSKWETHIPDELLWDSDLEVFSRLAFSLNTLPSVFFRNYE